MVIDAQTTKAIAANYEQVVPTRRGAAGSNTQVIPRNLAALQKIVDEAEKTL